MFNLDLVILDRTVRLGSMQTGFANHPIDAVFNFAGKHDPISIPITGANIQPSPNPDVFTGARTVGRAYASPIP